MTLINRVMPLVNIRSLYYNQIEYLIIYPLSLYSTNYERRCNRPRQYSNPKNGG